MRILLDLAAIPAWRIAPSDVPTIAMSEAFVLLHVDGVSTVKTIIEMSRLPEEEALRVLASLVARGVIELRSESSQGPDSRARSREERWTFSVEGEVPTGVRPRPFDDVFGELESEHNLETVRPSTRNRESKKGE